MLLDVLKKMEARIQHATVYGKTYPWYANSYYQETMGNLQEELCCLIVGMERKEIPLEVVF